MNYPQTLNKAKTLLQQKHYAQAVQTAASALEHVLVDLYNELLSKSSVARQKQLVQAIEQVGSGQEFSKFTLGKLVGLYRASRAHEDLEKTLGLSLTFLNTNALGPLVNIRNQAVHAAREPDPAEAAFIVNQVELILRETNRLPKASPTPAAEPQTLPPWWHEVIPHEDIRRGRFNLRDFAVDLAKVVAGQAVSEYKDAPTFFSRTYLTRGLRTTLTGVLRQLAGQDDGVAITQMATVFGGGKTHTLLALYHLVHHPAEVESLEPVQELLHDAGLTTIPPARVAAIDCAQISPSQPTVTAEGLILNTLWGEIAYRLGGAEGYAIVRQSDEDRAAPGSEALDKLFAAVGPSLILLDETLSYITKASAIQVGRGYLSDQAQEFLLELTRSVSGNDGVALVLTMTSSEPEQIGEAAIRAAREVDTATRILRRTRQVEVSAEREELYEIIKRRLFDADPATIAAKADRVADAYWTYFRAYPSDFPQESQAPEYRALMVQAYPFHPSLIEMLRDRWGSISGFQRTRGVLRLLALVIGDLYRHQRATPLIQPAHVNLDNGQIRAELLEYVDSRGGYESAIFSDIGGTDESKAPYLDRVTGGDYARYRIATGLATSIFMYSHSGATQRSASAEKPQLWLATLQPGIVPALAADALDKLRARLWYLVISESTYRIDSQPNLNQMLVTRMDAIRQEPETIRDKIRAAIDNLIGERDFSGSPVIWPEEPGQVANRPILTLVVLDPAYAWGPDEARQRKPRAFIEKLLNSTGNTFRQFKNALVFLLPTLEGVRVMEDTTIRLLALEAINRQYPRVRNTEHRSGLSDEQGQELDTQLDRARKGLPGAIWGAYTVTIAPAGQAKPDDGASAGSSPTNMPMTLWVRQEHGFPGYRPGEHTLAGRVRKRLVDDQRLLDRLDPRLISEGKGEQWRLWPSDEEKINVATLWDYFCRFPYLPMLTGQDALKQTIAWGVQRGLFGYALGDGDDFDTIYFQDSLPSGTFAVVEGAWLLRPTLVAQQRQKTEPAPQPEPPSEPVSPPSPQPPARSQPVPPRPTPQPQPQTYRQVTINTPIDWRQWYDFYQAIIVPLVEAGVEVKLELNIEAIGEIEANLIDLSVKESILQFNPNGQVEVE
ncbi:MAG: ATP-binding protein [Anaerolineae bacterium]|nr:ATP-binding protein [Anaerolineae bacterium]